MGSAKSQRKLHFVTLHDVERTRRSKRINSPALLNEAREREEGW